VGYDISPLSTVEFKILTDKPNVWTKLHIDSPSVARGLRYFSTQES
jgi:hypothetical protein